MHEYNAYSDGILEYINTLEAAHNKLKRVTVENPITNISLILIETDTMLKTGAFPRITNR